MTNYLGNFIKQKRGNLSLREFANLIGISHSHLGSIEKGFDPKTGKPVNISLEVLNKLAKVLDVEDLLLIYLAKIDYKEWPDYFEKLADFQKKYKCEAGILVTPFLDISSSDIRDRVSADKTIRYMVMPEVEKYIYDNHLYKSNEM